LPVGLSNHGEWSGHGKNQAEEVRLASAG